MLQTFNERSMNTSTLAVEKKQPKKTIRVSGSEALLMCLLEEGVDSIFGYPGGAIMPIYDALYGYQDKLTHYLTRHEQGAAHAAYGLYHRSGSFAFTGN